MFISNHVSNSVEKPIRFSGPLNIFKVHNFNDIFKFLIKCMGNFFKQDVSLYIEEKKNNNNLKYGFNFE